MFGFLKRRRRKRLKAEAPPPEWHGRLLRVMPYFKRLPADLQAELQQHMQVFLDEKQFEGCGGFVLDDDARLRISGYACLLLLNRRHDYFPLLKAVLVYPEPFVVRHHIEDESGVVEEGAVHEGESWDLGTVILSWTDLEADIAQLDGRNVILHEFAHQIYDSGDLALGGAAAYEAFHKTLEEHYRAHVRSVERDRTTFLDAYGAEDPAEFFSVITEAFFEQPNRFQHRHPELYDALMSAYRQDPRCYLSGNGTRPDRETGTD